MADESVDRQIVEALRLEGHAVLSVDEMSPGISDEIVLELANRKTALLLAADKDFGELVFRQNRASAGVIPIRLAGLAPGDKASLVADAILSHFTELERCFTVLGRKTVRIRRRFP